MIESPLLSELETARPRSALGHRALKLICFLGALAAVLVLLEGAFNIADWATDNVHRLRHLPAFVDKCLFLYLHILILGGALVAVEFLIPGSGSPKRYLTAAMFWAFYIPVAVSSTDMAHYLVQRLGITPLLELDFNTLKVGGAGGIALNIAIIFLACICYDFFYYWFHRLQHTAPFLWEFHSVHHANQSLNAIGCYHHPLEDLWKIPLFILPMAMTFEIVAPPLVFISAFVAAWGLFNHLDSRFSLGRLRLVLADNHYHRVHHSVAKEHHNSNFAGMFSPWDRLFGTQRMPPEGAEKLAVGLDDTPHPTTLREYFGVPFFGLARMLGARRSSAMRASGRQDSAR